MMKDLLRFFRAWRSGRYRATPWLSIGGILFALIYVINPFDFIPDYLPFVGVVDDALVLGLLYGAIRRDVGKFLAWEDTQRRVEQESRPETQKEMYRPKILKGPPLS